MDQSVILDRQLRNRDAGPWRHLPHENALEMPAQDFARVIEKTRHRDRSGYWVPRAAIFAGAAVLTIAFSVELHNLLATEVITPLQVVFLFLSTIAFGWIAAGSLSAALGFLPLFVGERPDSVDTPAIDQPLNSRTALLFPVYHESPGSVAATIEAMANELLRMERGDAFDIFILSDTRQKKQDTGEVMREAAIYQALSSKMRGRINVYYRRRMENQGKKAGNIGDWVSRFGGGYEHFVILDADSVMSGETLVALALTMERDHHAGLIQTVPRLIGGTTLLQRLQQFASNTYGPAVAAGLASWCRDQGNYWGHNAIIRTAAFASSAGLPELKGRAPFGGHILSHDFVEAVLLQRAGWGVHMMPTMEGSYEGMPPNLVDVVARDQRWAQGNLQHLAIVGQKGLTGMGRVHLAMGATSYLISAVWALSLIVGVILALQSQQMIPSYFKDARTLFPIWPVFDSGAALRLFLATMAVVLLPKALGLMLELKKASAMRDPKSAVRVTVGVFIETIFSMLIAPILMVTQTVAAIRILAGGKDGGWGPQRRGESVLPFFESLRFAKWHMLIGIVVAGLAWIVSPGLLIWMMPVLLGLVLAAPLVWWTSYRAGPLARWALATKEDLTPPQIVSHVAFFGERWQQQSHLEPSSAEEKVLPVASNPI